MELILCDLGDIASIKEFSKQIHEKYKRIDILVNNAGFISLDRQETNNGLERQFGINHIGHFILTTQLLDLMGEGSRIVVVASGAHLLYSINRIANKIGATKNTKKSPIKKYSILVTFTAIWRSFHFI
ncbi:MAG: SDR family NAD(P)-dependent oxidoreductase [Butyrivibrio sp.]|nr:SDR family NAD(P)-dependent oxidoreductase [Butyrivibrio sp.]